MSTRLPEGERALVTGGGIAKALKEEGAVALGSDIVAPPAGKSRSVARAPRTILPRSLSRSCQKDLVGM